MSDHEPAEELRRLQERLAFVLEVSELGLWDWNVQTGEVHFSPGWKRSLGYADDEVLPRIEFWESIVHPRDMAEIREALRAHFDGETDVYRCENRLQTRDGAWRWNLDRGRLVARDALGRPLRMLGVGTDLTEHQQAEARRAEGERRLLEAQKLESLGVLAGGVAHDFNNLLTGIQGNIALALQALPPDSPMAARLAEVDELSQQAASLCREMLVYAGRSRFAVEPTDLTAQVEQTAKLIEASVGRKALLEFHLERDLPPVTSNASQLRQILMNLVLNASEALGDGSGTIRVATGRTRVDASGPTRAQLSAELEEGEYGYLEVEDDGCGMDAETRERIYEPFFTTKFAGRGLGLAAALGIARGHGGALAVTSHPGIGSRFRLLLPLSPRASAPAKRGGASPAVTDNGGAVLVVDDERSVRRVTARMLESLGFEVAMAADGTEAVERFRALGDRVCCVLLDLTMPLMDGVEVHRALRALRPDVRIVLMSGLDADDVMRRVGDDATLSLQKPFRLAALREVVGCTRG